MKLTLKWDGESGDGKRAMVVAEENDGWKDLRIEVDTDDCDGDHAKKMMQEVIDRCNLPPDYRDSSEVVSMREENATLRSLLQQMLDVAENADETGYIIDVGFVDLGELHEKVCEALKT